MTLLPNPEVEVEALRRIRRIRNWFLAIFAVSSVVVIVISSVEVSSTALWWGAEIRFVPTLLASLTSLVGLAGTITTSVLAWRKERREAGRAAEELEKLKLENERLRLELQAKQDRPAEPARRRVKRP